jgi:3-hydroxyisobutyrate dehydrogenase-like beta-hydroxyacid dehydrogenase
MAGKLIDAGYDVRGWNRSTLPANLTAGIQPCQNLAEAARADVCLGGFADSKILQLHGTRMIDRSYVPGAKATIQLKDLKLATALAAEAMANLPHLASTHERYEKLVVDGDGELDHSAIHKLLWSQPFISDTPTI